MHTHEKYGEKNQAIRVGAIFPQTDIGADARDVARYATTIEEMGARHLLAFDHVVGGSLDTYPQLKNRYTSESIFHEVFVLFGYLSAITKDLELASGVIILPQRQTTLVAKQAAAIDVLSDGRLRLGVGIGWNEIEYQALNENFRNRARRMEEQIDLLRALWSDRLVDFDGKYHTVEQAGIHPLPPRRAIPIWIGGTAEPAVRRAARIADGFISTTPIGPQLETMLEWIRDELETHGRDRNEFGLEGRISLAAGDEDDWKREFSYWQEIGASHLSFNTMRGGWTDVGDHLNILERAWRAIETLR